MAYFGGHVQVTPKIYLVYWGWGQPCAFDHTTPGFPASDPDGAAARLTAFVKAIGGSAWAGVSTQYYETVNGQNVNIQNPSNVFGGVWYDDTNPIHNDVTGLELGYDYAAYENGDKCAWVGYNFGLTSPSTVPGGLTNITGNDGKQYPIQTLWSNESAGGTGYCAGGGNDFPVTG